MAPGFKAAAYPAAHTATCSLTRAGLTGTVPFTASTVCVGTRPLQKERAAFCFFVKALACGVDTSKLEASDSKDTRNIDSVKLKKNFLCIIFTILVHIFYYKIKQSRPEATLFN